MSSTPKITITTETVFLSAPSLKVAASPFFLACLKLTRQKPLIALERQYEHAITGRDFTETSLQAPIDNIIYTSPPIIANAPEFESFSISSRLSFV